jgi:hypothetical protein
VVISKGKTVPIKLNQCRQGNFTENYLKWVAMGAGAARLQAAQCRSLCYYKHHKWMVTVLVTLPDILPCVLRAGMGPLGKGSSSPEFWRNIQRYWILRRICRSINC